MSNRKQRKQRAKRRQEHERQRRDPGTVCTGNFHSCPECGNEINFCHPRCRGGRQCIENLPIYAVCEFCRQFLRMEPGTGPRYLELVPYPERNEYIVRWPGLADELFPYIEWWLYDFDELDFDSEFSVAIAGRMLNLTEDLFGLFVDRVRTCEQLDWMTRLFVDDISSAKAFVAISLCNATLADAEATYEILEDLPRPAPPVPQ